MKLRPGKWLDREGTVWTVYHKSNLPTEQLQRLSKIVERPFLGRAANPAQGSCFWLESGRFKSNKDSYLDLISPAYSLLTFRRTSDEN